MNKNPVTRLLLPPLARGGKISNNKPIVGTLSKRADLAPAAPPLSDEALALKREIDDVTQAITDEKRQRQKLKVQHEQLVKTVGLQRLDVDALRRKVDAAQSIIRANEGQDRAALQQGVEEFAAEVDMLNAECTAMQRQIASLSSQCQGTSSAAKVQQKIGVIRSQDEAKILRTWERRVQEAEAKLASQQPSSVRAKQTSGSAGNDEQDNSAVVLEQVRKDYQTRMARAQEDVLREAKAAQASSEAAVHAAAKTSTSLTTELAHLEQAVQQKEKAFTNLRSGVESLSKTLANLKKEREDCEIEKKSVRETIVLLEANLSSVQAKSQELSAALNQLLLLSSEAPAMHEKAWTQERSSLQGALNTELQRLAKLQTDYDNAQQRLRSATNESLLEAQLSEELASLTEPCKSLQEKLRAMQSSTSNATDGDEFAGSQKAVIIRDLEQAVKVEKRKRDELDALNDRLKKKLDETKDLLHAHGLDM